jgi:hypothetical protein
MLYLRSMRRVGLQRRETRGAQPNISKRWYCPWRLLGPMTLVWGCFWSPLLTMDDVCRELLAELLRKLISHFVLLGPTV